ncbi:MAG: YceI family protein [Deltaproteobacteria bacterium]|nr:MAG: YceI family protein [Deltaproteobacteria bacterium]
MARYDQSSGECLVFTYKEGLLSAVAHDLKVKVGRWELSYDGGAIDATFDPTSLSVVCAMRNGSDAPGAIPARDVKKIEGSIQSDVLATKRHREIRFRSTRVEASGDGYEIAGELTLVGRTRALTARAVREGGRLVAEVRLHQPDFGIKPFTAVFGTLKIQPHVTVRLAVPVEA